MSDDWGVPAPASDPEARKARVVRDEEGGARLVPDRDFVEGESLGIDKEGRGENASPGGCPFSH